MKANKPFDSQTSKKVAKEFKALSSLYFNAAYFGPSPERARLRMEEAVKKEVDPSFYPYPVWIHIPEVMRENLSKILPGTTPDQFALGTSSSDFMNQIVAGISHLFAKHPDYEYVIMDGDYPSNVLPGMLGKKNFGLKLKKLKCLLPDADWLAKKLPPKTKVFTISHVAFDSGRRIDLLSIGKLMKQRGILFVVDATQSLGGLDITPEELSYIDVLSCSTYKWMLGPYGSAFAYFSPKALKMIRPTLASWIKSPTSTGAGNLLNYTIEMLPGARAFDRGQSPNMLVNAGLLGSLELFQEMGIKNIERHNFALRDHFLENIDQKKYHVLTPKDGLSSIVCLRPASGKSDELQSKLKSKKIDVSVREGNLRISFHLYNHLKQVDTFLETLDHF